MYKILNSLDISGAPEINDIFQEHNLVNVGEDRKKILSEIDNCEAYLASAAIEIDKELLEKANKLKVIGSPNTGTDHMDLELIKQKGITCYDISKEFDLINSFTATSELAFTLLLSLIRKIIPASIDAKNGIWSREKYSGIQLFNKTFGIIGLGRLGEISAIAPIRYTRLFFAMGFGALVFNEIPDNFTLLGAGIIVISGLYAFLREVRMSKASLYSKS